MFVTVMVIGEIAPYPVSAVPNLGDSGDAEMLKFAAPATVNRGRTSADTSFEPVMVITGSYVPADNP